MISGKVQEHLAPLFPEFIAQFNPKDARFLGSPLDFVVFDGLDDGLVKRVVFVEVKSGKANLQSRERLCRDEFRKALGADPALELEPAEAGHPVWGPIFRAVKAGR